MPNEKMYEKCMNFQKYALHDAIVSVLHFDGTSGVWVQPLAQYPCLS